VSFDWLVARPIAHRGWHNADRPENSLAAATAARDAGYAVECDVQLSADGEAVVFHDERLERLTGAEGRVVDSPLARLRALRLAGGPERIPTLGELLARLAGGVALICEIKSRFDGDMRLADRAVAAAAEYSGALAFKSFDPEVIAHLRATDCPRPLGVVAEADYGDPYFAAMSRQAKRDAGAFLHVGRTRPDFLSFRVNDLPHPTPTLTRAYGAKPVMAWTVRAPDDWALVRRYADQAVFEGEPA
jgi:glycerophosphoryl diester phosphodiesterase